MRMFGETEIWISVQLDMAGQIGALLDLPSHESEFPPGNLRYWTDHHVILGQSSTNHLLYIDLYSL